MHTTRKQLTGELTGAAPAALALVATITWLAWPTDRSSPTPSPDPAVAAAASGAAPAKIDACGPRVTVAAVDGFYAAPIGTRFVYALDGRIDYALAQLDGARQTSGVTLDGAFEVAVADRRDGEVLLEAGFPDLRLTATRRDTSDDAALRLTTAAGERFLVRIGDDGRVHGYRFLSDLDGEQRNFVRALFAAYAHTVPPGASGTWEAADSDATGELVARFTLDDRNGAEVRSVEREKLRYTAMGTCPELQPHRLSGRSRATFSRELGWLREVEVSERSVLELADLGLSVDVGTSLHFRLTGHDGGGAGPAPGHWEGVWRPASGLGEQLGSSGEERERAAWQSRLATESLDTLLSRLTALLAADPRDEAAIDELWRALTWLVQLRPEVAAEIRDRIAGGLSGETADLLMSALGAADGAAGESALSDLRRDPAMPSEIRESAMLALAELDAPSERAVGALVADLRTSALLADGDDNALLLLGALCPRTSGHLDDGASAFDALVGFEAAARSQGRLTLWLDALGNAGTPAVLPYAARYARSDDAEVRAAAYQALRKVPGPEAVALLRRGTEDPDPVVRGCVIAALADRDEPAATDALLRAARVDVDDGVRRAALIALANRAAPGSPLRRELEACRTADPCEANRALLRELLQP